MDHFLKELIPNLRCPETGSELRSMLADEINTLNAKIQSGTMKTQEGVVIKEPVKEALVNADGSYVYPVLEEKIAVLLPDKAIPINKGEDLAAPLSAADKKKVRDFYDEFGWQKAEDSSYKDTVAFEDRRPVSQEYWSRCHMRLNKYLKGGDYLLDVASGAIPNDEYLTYSQRYKLRICMDFSLLALKEAAERLDGKGIFILGDMTNIPIAENCIDAVISMHTVYHIPVEEQTKAVAESYRVLKPGRQAIIVYSWNKSPLMKAAFKLWGPILEGYKKIRNKPVRKKNEQTEKTPELFVQQQDYKWFSDQIRDQYNGRLGVYSAISRSFSHTFLRKKMFGRQFSSFIYWMENQMPSLMGRLGQYPIFLLEKKPKTYQSNSALSA